MITFNHIHISIERKIEIILYHSNRSFYKNKGNKDSYLSGQKFFFFSLKVVIKVGSYMQVFTVSVMP